MLSRPAAKVMREYTPVCAPGYAAWLVNADSPGRSRPVVAANINPRRGHCCVRPGRLTLPAHVDRATAVRRPALAHDALYILVEPVIDRQFLAGLDVAEAHIKNVPLDNFGVQV